MDRAENSETYVNGFNTTEDVLDVSALLLLVEYDPCEMVRRSMIQLPPHQHDLPSIEAGQASPPTEWTLGCFG